MRHGLSMSAKVAWVVFAVLVAMFAAVVWQTNRTPSIVETCRNKDTHEELRYSKMDDGTMIGGIVAVCPDGRERHVQ